MRKEGRLEFLPWFLFALIIGIAFCAIVGHAIVAPMIGAAQATFGPAVGIVLWIAAGWLGLVVILLGGLVGLVAHDRKVYGQYAQDVPAELTDN